MWKISKDDLAPLNNELDITDSTILRWWLWIVNLGKHSRDVIGPGVTRARVSMTDDGNMATFTFDRADGTRRQVFLSLNRHNGLDINVS